MLLLDKDDDRDPTSTIGSTNANNNRTNPASRASSENSEPRTKE
jgi:hypothetical protein